ncbi:MAG: SRPBCC family protein [Actinomycetota bacterium]
MIETTVSTTAEAPTVHELLVDTDAWSTWSPHVAGLDAPSTRVEPGWVGKPRAFFSPMAIAMVVTEVYPDGGYDWHSTLGPWRLEYQNRVMATDDGSTIRFTAELSGPLGSVLEKVVGPLSARGQRNRMARLAEMAESTEPAP